LIDGFFFLLPSLLLIADDRHCLVFGMVWEERVWRESVTVNVFHFPSHPWNVKEERKALWNSASLLDKWCNVDEWV
jgi:hypothetical protein